ncbi:MAG: ABC transporter ATP-binding protein [Chloroflexi bacterium]|nr:ABC transporter ATP-binding protein [Chloroflexota bacterium]
MAIIQTEGLTKYYGPTLGVEDLSFQVEEGEVFGFLGPNGAGKTTTVRMLSCLVAPTRGRASVNGHRIGVENQAIRQIIGILTESPGLYEKLSAWKNLDIYARLYGLSGQLREKQVRRYLEMLGLWERRNETVGEFSKGMKQKMAIARALIHEPRVLFLDEPTAALDPEAARVVRHFIAELKTEGRTILLCTHNLDEADRLCDRIGVMKQHLIQVDTPANLRQRLYGRKIVVHLKALTEPLVAAVRSLPFIKSIERIDNQLVIGLDNPEEQNPILVLNLVQAGGQVQFVNELRHSLEEVYFSLIDGGKAA